MALKWVKSSLWRLKNIFMKTSQSFGVHFTIRTDKEKEGNAPVYACITVNKKRCYIALKQFVDINYWDNTKGALKGTREDITFHLARHTFATTVTLSNGVPIET